MMRVTLLKHEGRYYPLVFSINAAEKIEDLYAPFEHIGNVLVNPKKYGFNGIKVVKDILYILMQEGIEYCNYHDLKVIKKRKLCLELPNEDDLFRFKQYKQMKGYINILYECLLESKKKQSSTDREKEEKE